MIKQSRFLTWLTCFSLVASLCSGILITDRAQAQAPHSHGGNDQFSRDDDDDDDEGDHRGHGRSKRRAFTGEKVSAELKKLARDSGHRRVKVIMQTSDSDDDAEIESHLKDKGGRVTGQMKRLGALAIELPARAAEALAEHRQVEFVSLDQEVQALGGHIAQTTGADAVRQQTTTTTSTTTTTTSTSTSTTTVSSTTSYTLDGTGIGIAVLDSGIDPRHDSFT
ncbi:MAG: hypothetical protein M3371_05540, partial [Acidobacteriota bacterium]|nr:hypothetical protein [Acidobacteriota bacterium]